MVTYSYPNQGITYQEQILTSIEDFKTPHIISYFYEPVIVGIFLAIHDILFHIYCISYMHLSRIVYIVLIIDLLFCCTF